MDGVPAAWWAFPRRHPVWTTLLAAAAGLLVLLALFDWNWLKGPVQQAVAQATGRELRIDGDLDVELVPLRVRTGRLRFANAAWSSEPVMARAEQLDMRVRFWPLLAGRVVLPELSLVRPQLRLERSPTGVGNWLFPGRRDCRDGCRSRVRILQLLASDGLLELHEPALRTSARVHFDSAAPAGDDALAPLLLRGEGMYRSAPFELSGQVDSPLALQDTARPYRVDLAARAGQTSARLYGTLTEPLQVQDFTVNFELRGEDLADLYELAGIVMPTTPRYELRGRLGRHGQRFTYRDFSGVVGDSDVAGSAGLLVGGARPKLDAQLASRRVDLDDLAGFIGGAPAAGRGETAPGPAAVRMRPAPGKVLPSTPIRLDKLRAMDADVQWQASQVQSRRLPLEDMRAHLLLEDGRLVLDPLEFGAAGGRLASTAQLDARGDPARFGIAMHVQGLQLPRLLRRPGLLEGSSGRIAGAVDLQGEGNSAAAILASSDGNLGLIMGQGRVSNLLLEIAGLDIAEALAFLIGKDRQVTLRCAYADFGVADGMATARAVAFDTTDTALLVRGGFSFDDESLDLTLLPRPKDFSPVAIRTPLAIRGTFKDPAIGPKGGRLVLRGAAVAALAAIAPPLALLGLLETGPGKDNANCGPAPARPPPPPAPATPPGPRPPVLSPAPERNRS